MSRHDNYIDILIFVRLPGRMVEIVPPPLALQRSGTPGDCDDHARFRGLGSVNSFLSCPDRCYSEVTNTLLIHCSTGASWPVVIIGPVQPPLRIASSSGGLTPPSVVSSGGSPVEIFENPYQN